MELWKRKQIQIFITHIEIESRFGYGIWSKSNINIPCVNQKRNGVCKNSKIPKNQTPMLIGGIRTWWLIIHEHNVNHIGSSHMNLNLSSLSLQIEELPKLVRNINNVDC